MLVLLASLAGMFLADSEEAKEKAAGPFKGLHYRLIGPSAGGRVCRVAGVPGDPLVYYAATANSGVWKSSDGGLRWSPVFDDQPCASIGSIAVAASDPNVVYVGAGEANIRGNVAEGLGIFKSTDAGKSWKHVWKQRGQIGTMIVHPTNPDIAFAAVLGRAFGPNEDRGVYRTTDGGKNWKRVLTGGPDAGAADVCFDPSNPRILFASLWETRRRPWTLTSGGPKSGLFVSRDGGETWKSLKENGLPPKPWGKIGVAVAPSDSRRVYALIEADKGGLFASFDGGEKWSQATDDRAIRQRAWYYSTLTIDPTNADVVWAPQVPLLKSIDAGKTFKRVSGPHHGDHHDLWIDPKNSRRLVNANDGGVDLSFDGGETWFSPPLPISQFYRINVDNRTPYHIYGTMQDIGSTAGPSNSLASGGISPDDWFSVGGGEAGYVAPDPTDPDIVFAGEYDGIFTRYDRRTGQARHVGVYPFNSSGHGAEAKKYRFRWPAPAMISPHNPKALYHAGNVLFRSLDGGQTWSPLGGDLTRNDKTKQRWSGGPITGDNTGAEHYCTLSAIAESPAKAGVLWTGSDDGLVHVSQDDGKTWTNISNNIDGLPEWSTIQHIESSKTAPETAFVVADAHMMDDPKPYLWKTTDFGKTWKALVKGIPDSVTLHVVREDPTNAKLLYLGTEIGVMFSRDGGDSWQSLKLNMPTAAVHDLRVAGDDLVVATMGRSLWILDGLTPIRETTEEILEKAVHLHTPAATVKWGIRSTSRRPGAGDNPTYGVAIDYRLKREVKGLKLEILDAKNALVAELEGKSERKPGDDDEDDAEEPKKKPLPMKAGLHRVDWNLRSKPPKRIPKAKVDAGNLRVGPAVLPGEYTARLTIGKTIESKKFTVKLDPRSRAAAGDLAAQFDLATKLRDDLSLLSKTVVRIQKVRAQLDLRSKLLAGVPGAEEMIKASKEAIDKLNAFEERLHNPKAKVTYDILAFKGGAKLYSQLSSLYSFVSDGEGAPTQGMTDVYADYSKELTTVLSEVDRFLATTLGELNNKAKAKDWPTIFVPRLAKD
jgi:photosystem II stability/assembly factor-like uncharacterized protein